MTIIEPTGPAQSPGTLKHELAVVSTAKGELTAREHALRIQIDWLESIGEASPAQATRTLIAGPAASGKTTVLQSLVADAELRGHRVITITGPTTQAGAALRIATELERIEAEPSVLIIVVDDVDALGGEVLAAVAAAAGQHGTWRVHVVVTSEMEGLDETSYFDRVVSLGRI